MYGCPDCKTAVSLLIEKERVIRALLAQLGDEATITLPGGDYHDIRVDVTRLPGDRQVLRPWPKQTA